MAKSTITLAKIPTFGKRVKCDWHIEVILPSPSMNVERFAFDGTYQEAVDKVHEIYQECGRSVSLKSSSGTYVWHRVCGFSGDIWERNTNSGVKFPKYNNNPIKKD